MIDFVGSNYKYQGEKLESPSLIYVRDHHYNEYDKCFHVLALLENSICDPQQHLILFDHVVQEDDALVKYNTMCLPLYLAKSCKEFQKQQIQKNWNNKITSFNFMINKIRLHRQFLLVMLEHFGLVTDHYTLCWKNIYISRKHMGQEITNPVYRDLLDGQVNLQSRQFLLGQEVLLDWGLQYGPVSNSENYQKFLQENVFEPSCVSLITEPVLYERETIVTEKTIMAIYGGTLPIWVGG